MRIHFIVLSFFLLSCNSRTSELKQFSYPPEWEAHDAIWADFGTEFTVVPNQDSKAEIITVLSQYINTKVVFDDDSLKQMAINLLKNKNANLDSIQFVKTSGPMNWVRDPGPIFVSNGTSLRSLDFGWNCYGLSYDCENDFRGEIDNELAEQMNIEIDSVGIYLEGGGIEVSSNTILAYKAMASQRNPNKTLDEVSKTLIKSLGKEQIIWLDEFPLIDKPGNKIANYFGNGANGHIDISTRFLNDSTILATIISEEDKEKSDVLRKDYEILNSNLKQLKAAKQTNGKPFTIITIEAPDYSLYEYEW